MNIGYYLEVNFDVQLTSRLNFWVFLSITDLPEYTLKYNFISYFVSSYDILGRWSILKNFGKASVKKHALMSCSCVSALASKRCNYKKLELKNKLQTQNTNPKPLHLKQNHHFGCSPNQQFYWLWKYINCLDVISFKGGRSSSQLMA